LCDHVVADGGSNLPLYPSREISDSIPDSSPCILVLSVEQGMALRPTLVAASLLACSYVFFWFLGILRVRGGKDRLDC